jgi:porin
MSESSALRRVLLAIGLGICSMVTLAQTTSTTELESNVYQSGYDKVPQFGGPDGVSAQLEEADRAGEPIFRGEAPARWFQPWYDWKAEINEQNDLAFGFFFSFLGQKASDSSTSEDNALGGVYRFNGTWTLFDTKGKDPGRIEWRVEARSNVGDFQAPQTLSSAIGVAAVNSGFAYSERFKTDLAVLNWTQGFRDSTAGIAVGRLAFDVYLDAFAFQTVSGGFVNRAFILNPTIGTTGIGALGAVARGFVSDQVYVGAQIYDGNAVSGEWDFDTFQEHEFLKAVEIGWTPAIARRKTDKIQLTYWDKDARTLAGVPGGNGWAVSASFGVGENWLPFLRYGDSDGGAGAAAEKALSTGFQYTVRDDQKVVFGVSWAKPSEKTNGAELDDEYVIETSYNFQIAKNFSLLPDLQLILDPANFPEKSSVLVSSLRAIVTF